MAEEKEILGEKVFNGVRYLSLTEAAKRTPYSQEYLSLRARHGKLSARKFGGNWYVTQSVIDEYLGRRVNQNIAENLNIHLAAASAQIPKSIPAPPPSPIHHVAVSTAGPVHRQSWQAGPSSKKPRRHRAYAYTLAAIWMVLSGITIHNKSDNLEWLAMSRIGADAVQTSTASIVDQIGDTATGVVNSVECFFSGLFGSPCGGITVAPQTNNEQPTTDDRQHTTDNTQQTSYNSQATTPLNKQLTAIAPAPTRAELLSAVEDYFSHGLSPSLVTQLQGPKGDKGDTGLMGIQGPSGFSIGAVYPTANNQNAGTIGGITYFGAKEITTQTLTATGATTLASLVADSATITGALSAGTSTLGATTLSSLEVTGTASSSQFFGSGLSACAGTSSKLLYNSTTGLFSCGTDVGASAGATLAVNEAGGAFSNISSLSFSASGFTVTTASSLSTIGLDYLNGPASRALSNTWSALNTFSAGASVSTALELTSGYASLSNTLWVSPPGYAGIVGIGFKPVDTQYKVIVRGDSTNSISALNLRNNAGANPTTFNRLLGITDEAPTISYGAIDISSDALRLVSNAIKLRLETNNASYPVLLQAGGGNVGIGSLGPEQRLEVGGNILASASGAVDLTLNNTAATYGKFILRSMATPAAGRLDIIGGAAGATTFMSIASNGNVGIGTTTPAAKFEVNGPSMRLTNGGEGISMAQATSSRWIIQRVGSTTNALDFTSWTNVTVSGGSFGVGSISPDSKLDVAGNILASASGAVDLTLNNTAATYGKFILRSMATPAAGRLDIIGGAAGATTFMSIASSGNVGIGTTAPGTKLRVNGDISIDYGQFLRGGDAPTTDNQILMYNSSTGDMEIELHNTGWYLRHNANMTIAGNVGIGSTTPEQKLEVAGNILASASAASVGLILNNLAENDAKFTIQSTGTAGSVARLDFLGSASQTFMSIASSGNVGIGTTSPSTMLTLVGANGGYTALSILDNSYPSVDAGFQIRYNDATGDTYLDSRYYSGNNANIYFRTATAGTPINAMTILGTGNVGIGSLGPEQRLEVGGNILASASGNVDFTLNSTNTEDSKFTIRSAGSNDRLEVLSSASVNLLSITKSGQIGIGVAAPLYGVDIQRTVNTVAIRANSNVAGDILYYGTGTVTGDINFFQSAIDATGTVRGIVKNTNSTSDANASIDINTNGASAGDPYITFTVSTVQNWIVGIDNSDSDKFKISSSGTLGNSDRITIQTSGQVGIGDATPDAFLDVAGSGIFDNELMVSGALQVAHTATVAYSRFGTNATTGAFLNSADDLLISGDFESDGVMRFEGTGSHSAAGEWNFDSNTLVVDAGTNNVGIGTTGPSELLHLQATATNLKLRIANSTFGGASQTSEVVLANRDDGGVFYDGGIIKSIQTNGTNSLASSDLAFFTGQTWNGANYGTPSERVRITSTGNVGIGSTGPEQKLEVAGNILASASGAVDLTLNNTAATYGKFILRSMATPAAGRLDIIGGAAGATTFMSIASSGNVGIGTTNPQGKLHVSGGLAVVGNGYGYYVRNAANSASLRAIDIDSNNDTTIGPNAVLRIQTGAGTDAVFIKSTGNVGIGSTGPEQKLEVAGNILASASGAIDLTLNNTATTYGKFILRSMATPNAGRLDIIGGAAGATTFMSIASSGYVGIGTTGPGEKLEVSGNIKLTSSANAIRDFNGNNLLNNTSGTLTLGNVALNIGAVYQVGATTDTSFKRSTTTDLFIQGSSGNVGIGTTVPTAKLDVAGDLQINISSSSGAANSFALCHTSNGATSDQFVIDCGNAPSADYMEMYPTSQDIEEGEIMVPSSTSFVLDTLNNKVPKLVRSSRPYQDGIIGITSIASQAGDFNSIGYNIPQLTTDNLQLTTKPLALSGRVLLKVSTDNGPIRVGDRITSSVLPGIGMKATVAGMTVGTALSATTDNLQLTTGTYQRIMVFVGAQYWAPELTTDNLPLTTSASGSWLDGTFQSLFGMIVDAFRSMFGIVFERGKVQADQLCAGSVCVNEQQLQQLLNSVGGTIPSVSETPTPSSSPTPEAPATEATPTPDAPTPTPSSSPTPEAPATEATPTPDTTPPVEPPPAETP